MRIEEIQGLFINGTQYSFPQNEDELYNIIKMRLDDSEYFGVKDSVYLTFGKQGLRLSVKGFTRDSRNGSIPIFFFKSKDLDLRQYNSNDEGGLSIENRNHLKYVLDILTLELL